MVVNLTWHSFMEQVWGIRLRCLTNCTCCETSELELFSHTVWLARWFVRAPEEALHKKTLYSVHEDILTTGRHNDERQLHRRKKSTAVFARRGTKELWQNHHSHSTPCSLNTCCHYSEATCCWRRPLLTDAKQETSEATAVDDVAVDPETAATPFVLKK